MQNDVTPPHPNIRFEGTQDTDNESFTGAVTYTPVAEDGADGSGVETMFVRVDNGSWATTYGFTSVLEEEGKHKLEIYAVDKAGNVSKINSFTVRINHADEEKVTP